MYFLVFLNFDYDSNFFFEVVVDCIDFINIVLELLYVYFIKNLELVVYNLLSKLYFRRFFFFFEVNDSYSIYVIKLKLMNI